MKRLLLGLLLFGVLPLAVYGVIAQIRAAGRRQEVITKTLILPYARALQEGRYAEAYDTLTSPAYRSLHSLEEFEKAQVATRTERGALATIEVRSAFQAAGELFSERRYLRGELTYHYEKGEALVVWEISESTQGFLIDAQLEDLTDTLRPGIF